MSRYVNVHTHRPTGRHIEPTAAGIHPWSAGSDDCALLDNFPCEVDAVGETGLDRMRGASPERQAELFRRHLQTAVERNLPVVVHCVRAFEDTMLILNEYESLRAVIFHGFIGSREQARRALDRGYYLSFGERSLKSPRSVEVLRSMPVGQLFLETDDSEMPIEDIYAAAAEIRDMDIAELQDAILENYKKVFEKR